MNQILVYVGIGFAVLFLAMVVPGLKVIAEGILKLLMDFFVEIFKHKSTFFIWFVKTLVADHIALFMHAIKKRDDIDPTQKIRRQAKGYED